MITEKQAKEIVIDLLPKGVEIVECYEYGDCYVMSTGSKDQNGRYWVGSMMTAVMKSNGKVKDVDRCDIPKRHYKMQIT